MPALTESYDSERRFSGEHHNYQCAAAMAARERTVSIDREALELGWRLLQQLPEEQREVFVLYEVEDMSMPEIARALDCPLQTAYARLYAARARILAQVQRAPAENEP